MKTRKYRYFSCDFETTVYEGQQDTQVWAAACVELYTENVLIHHSIREQFDYFKSLNENIIGYYHNLKFDGSFWLYFLLHDLQYEVALSKIGQGTYDYEWKSDKDMPPKSFKYSISDRGQWYTITIKTVTNKIIQYRDSLKLLPFSVERIGKSFGTKHQKLNMEYKGVRYPGCPITEEERKYIENDVLVVKEALEIAFNEGHNKLTIGACCLNEYKNGMSKDLYQSMFPDMTDVPLADSFDAVTVDEYIRRSYKGGWCYLVKGKQNRIYNNGTTADVNSLYPSMMHSESGNVYPIGYPSFWQGNTIPEEAQAENKYFFIRIKTRFYLKKGYLPFIQIKGSWLYPSTECLESSDVYDPINKRYSAVYRDFEGNIVDTRVTLTLTCTDYILFREHYDVVDFEIVDGCYFNARSGIFDDYINKYKQIKTTSKGAKRELAKLFLNNLYGKMASNKESSFKIAYIGEEGGLKYQTIKQYEKKAGYIPVGSAITSYARNFTIRAAQKNYHGVNAPGFIYADTDSIHCDLPPDKIKGIKVHPTDFCCWKLETSWNIGFFVRQKTYIEHVVKEDLQPIDEPYYNIKCAGMPDTCKNLFRASMEGTADERRIEGDVEEDGKTLKQYTEAEREYLFDEGGHKIIRTIEDFRVGMKIPGKLMPKNIRGGILLVDTYYTMRNYKGD